MNGGSEVDVNSTTNGLYSRYILSDLINDDNDDGNSGKNVKHIETFRKTDSDSHNLQPNDTTAATVKTLSSSTDSKAVYREFIGPTDVDVEDAISTITQNTLLSNNKSLESFHSSHSDIMWVPADKHPEIAPDEFANFIQTMGANATRRRSSTLHRKKSILAHSVNPSPTSSRNDDVSTKDQSEEEQAEGEEGDKEERGIERTLSEKKRLFLQKVLKDETHEQGEMTDGTSKSTYAFDRNSTPSDDSQAIAPRSDKSLLRRSAFSARGRSRRSVTNGRSAQGEELDSDTKIHRRSLSQREAPVDLPADDVSMLVSVPSFTRSNSSASNGSNCTTNTATAGSNTWDKVHGITLIDQTVRKADYIDMGSELKTPALPMLSRVQEAESQVLSSSSPSAVIPAVIPQQQHLAEALGRNNVLVSNEEALSTTAVSIETEKEATGKQLVKESEQDLSTDDEDEEEEVHLAKIDDKLSASIVANTSTAATANIIAKEEGKEALKRPAIIRSESDIVTATNTTATPSTKPVKRSSWFAGLFTSSTIEKKASTVGKREKEKVKKTAPATTAVAAVNNNPSIAASAFSSIASIFTRPLSTKSSANNSTNAASDNASIGKSKGKQKTTTENQKKRKKKKRASNSISESTTNTSDLNSTPEFPTPFNNYATTSTLLFNSNRLPLHVERAIYRLSHFKLSDPRRPLCEQVVISNFMFWYLSLQQNDAHSQATSFSSTTATPSIPERHQQSSLTPNNIPSQHQLSAKKASSKMSKFINSAKKRRNEMAQFVQNYPVPGAESKTSTATTRKSNVQFSLPTPPPRYSRANSNQSMNHDANSAAAGEEEEEEGDDVPLSHFKS